MKKKFFVISALLVSLLAISTSYAFANTNMVNTVEHAAQNITSDAGNMLNNSANATKNTINNISAGTQRTGNNIVSGTTTNNNRTGNYNATRTNTNATWLGMDSTAWTWLIMGIVAVAIIALVWSYARQKNTSTNSNNE